MALVSCIHLFAGALAPRCEPILRNTLFKIVHQLAKGQNGLRILIWDLDPKTLLQTQEELYGGHGVEFIHPKVLHEGVIGRKAFKAIWDVLRKDFTDLSPEQSTAL